MGKVVLPPSSILENSVVKAVKALGGKATTKQIHDLVVTELRLTEEQITTIHEGRRTELEYRLAWARTSAKKKGLLVPVGIKIWSLP